MKAHFLLTLSAAILFTVLEAWVFADASATAAQLRTPPAAVLAARAGE